MEHRKNLNKDLRRQSGLFFQIGLLIAMMLCVSAFEYRAKVVTQPVDITQIDPEDEWTPNITYQKPPPPPPKPKMAKPVESKQEVEDDIPDDIVIDPSTIEISEIDIPEDEPFVEPFEEDFIFVESMPEPKGGLQSFYDFINKNLRYPSMARKLGVEGKVFVEFVVDKSGELVRIKILKGIGSGCDEEVMRVMKKAPAWNPGKQRGVPVNVRKTLPIYFKLD